jgi:hypothetical protein
MGLIAAILAALTSDFFVFGAQKRGTITCRANSRKPTM